MSFEWIGKQLSLFDSPHINSDDDNCQGVQKRKRWRLTHDEVEAAFRAEGYELLDRYVGSKIKMHFRCPNGHLHQMTWDSFKMGHRCKLCGTQKTRDKQRFSHEKVKASLEAEGYQLLSQYETARLPIMVTCPEGHKHKTTWASFNSGIRCRLCSRRQSGLKRRLSRENVEAAFSAEGYQLLDQYETAHAKLRFICTQGHHHAISWAQFKQGKRCKFCSLEIRAKKRRISPEYVKTAFEAEGYQLLDTYTRNSVKMRFICSKGHQGLIRWADFNRGCRCELCAREIRGKKRRRTHEYVEAAFTAEGYQLLDKYEGAHKKMGFICPKGHRHEINWTNFSQGYRCAYCAGAVVTHEMVEAAFTAAGYQLLDRYENSKNRMKSICPDGHQYTTSWGNFLSGHRCSHCAGRIVTHEDVETAFAKEGYQLLDKYKNNSTKMRFICPQEHEHSIRYADFRRGNRCAYCMGKIVDHKEVEAVFKSFGYKLLTPYKNSDQKIKFLCPNGHNHSITWNSFKNGSRCAYCAGKIVTHEEVEAAFALAGYQLLDQYARSDKKMRYICPEGHQHQVIWEAFKRGVRCPYCAGMILTDEQRQINAIKHNIATLIQFYLRRQEAQKTFSISTFAGRVAKEIFNVLGTRPDEHHLDHIVPQSYFDFRNQKEIEACWDIANLRYFPALKNVGRGNRLTLKEVEEFNEKQLDILRKASLKPSKFCKDLNQDFLE